MPSKDLNKKPTIPEVPFSFGLLCEPSCCVPALAPNLEEKLSFASAADFVVILRISRISLASGMLCL